MRLRCQWAESTTAFNMKGGNVRRRLGDNDARCMRLIRRRLAVGCLSLLLGLQTGCYHYRVSGEEVPVGSEAKQTTLWSSLWGTPAAEYRYRPDVSEQPDRRSHDVEQFGLCVVDGAQSRFCGPHRRRMEVCQGPSQQRWEPFWGVSAWLRATTTSAAYRRQRDDGRATTADTLYTRSGLDKQAPECVHAHRTSV